MAGCCSFELQSDLRCAIWCAECLCDAIKIRWPAAENSQISRVAIRDHRQFQHVEWYISPSLCNPTKTQKNQLSPRDHWLRPLHASQRGLEENFLVLGVIKVPS